MKEWKEKFLSYLQAIKNASVHTLRNYGMDLADFQGFAQTEDIKTIDKSGNIVDEKTEEKVVCDDGVKDFLHGMGIADNCQFFTWMMPLGQTMVEQRSIACKRLDGGYEIVQGYHYIK